MAPIKLTRFQGSVALLIALLGSAGLAKAQIYMCKDANGRTLTSDRPIPECANRAVKELGKDGTVKREIPPPLTPEQARLKKEADEKRKADEAAAAEQRRRDVLLLTTYLNEQQIEAERQRSVIQIRNNINIAITSQNNAEQRRKAAQAEADQLKKAGKMVPSSLKARIEEAQRSYEHEGKNIEATEAEMAKVKTKYDDILKRYRAVSAGPGEASAGGKN